MDSKDRGKAYIYVGKRIGGDNKVFRAFFPKKSGEKLHFRKSRPYSVGQIVFIENLGKGYRLGFGKEIVEDERLGEWQIKNDAVEEIARDKREGTPLKRQGKMISVKKH